VQLKFAKLDELEFRRLFKPTTVYNEGLFLLSRHKIRALFFRNIPEIEKK
jgi:hypothetical protein